jgi:dihydrolipoamide dehydrogenase
MAVPQIETDVVVIGAGPGGYAAAFYAADLGLQVTMVDTREKPGGVCLNVGCIPSKALLHAAEVIAEVRESKEIGITFEEPSIDLERLRSWKEKIVSQLTGGLGQLGKKRGVEYVQARARFGDPRTLVLGDGDAGIIKFQRAIIATGSRPSSVPGLDLESGKIMDSTEALELPDVPKRLLVVGGGYIGLELGTVYAALGSKVTVVEMLKGLLPGADKDLVRPLERRIRESFEAVYTETKVVSVEETKERLRVQFEGKTDEVQTFDRVLVAVGRRPNSDDLGLEKIGIVPDEAGFITVDQQCRTGHENIFAIGDVAGQPMLAHKAIREGKVVAEVLAGQPAAFDNQAIPAVVFTNPEVAWTGLTETEAKSKGIEFKVARFPWAASGRALTLGRSEGLTKMIFEPQSGRILGVGIVGPNAGELIAEGNLAIEMAAVAEDLALTIHAHPTLSETVGEVAEVFLGHATHLYRKKS